jgi:hypothetical protein
MSDTSKIKKTEETSESIDQQQADAAKISAVLASGVFTRWMKYSKLTDKQKELYKVISKKSKENVDTLKKNFNRENIFEVENFNF